MEGRQWEQNSCWATKQLPVGRQKPELQSYQAIPARRPRKLLTIARNTRVCMLNGRPTKSMALKWLWEPR